MKRLMVTTIGAYPGSIPSFPVEIRAKGHIIWIATNGIVI